MNLLRRSRNWSNLSRDGHYLFLIDRTEGQQQGIDDCHRDSEGMEFGDRSSASGENDICLATNHGTKSVGQKNNRSVLLIGIFEDHLRDWGSC